MSVLSLETMHVKSELCSFKHVGAISILRLLREHTLTKTLSVILEETISQLINQTNHIVTPNTHEQCDKS